MNVLNLEKQKKMHEFKIEITIQADLELKETADYIALDNPTRARSFVRDLVIHFTKILSTFPESGKMMVIKLDSFLIKVIRVFMK